jgi:uncharacterized protein (DUF427 family)
MDAFYDEGERILGHAADPYHHLDIRQTSRSLVVRSGGRIVAKTREPIALYESGVAPPWYVPRADIDESALTPAAGQTFCPYKRLCSYYDLATPTGRHGHVVRPIPRSGASQTWCLSSRMRYRCNSTTASSISSRAR